jgi:hypothetical protein
MRPSPCNLEGTGSASARSRMRTWRRERKGLLTRQHPGPRDVVPQLGSVSAETLRTLEEKRWSCASKQRCHGLAYRIKCGLIS